MFQLIQQVKKSKWGLRKDIVYYIRLPGQFEDEDEEDIPKGTEGQRKRGS